MRTGTQGDGTTLEEQELWNHPGGFLGSGTSDKGLMSFPQAAGVGEDILLPQPSDSVRDIVGSRQRLGTKAPSRETECARCRAHTWDVLSLSGCS